MKKPPRDRRLFQRKKKKGKEIANSAACHGRNRPGTGSTASRNTHILSKEKYNTGPPEIATGLLIKILTTFGENNL
jgi:hypothetical protein